MQSPQLLFNGERYGGSRNQCVLNKFPSFWRIDPEIWFVQVEAFFNINGIIDESDKFTVLVANLDEDVLPHIADIIRSSLRVSSQDRNQMYRVVKQRILKVFDMSEEARLRGLIRDHIDVVHRPSQLLNAMEASSERVNSQLIKNLFVESVSEKFKCRFSKVHQSIEEIGEIADSIAATEEPFFIF